MASQDHFPEIERQVLAAVGEENSVSSIAVQLGQSAEAVNAVLVRLGDAGLVQAGWHSVTLTDQGRRVVAAMSSSTRASTGQVGAPDAGNMAGSLESVWSAYLAQRAAARGRARDKLLASDKDRDAAAQLLAEAFAQGRLSSSEFEARTGRALSAATYGELDDVLQGLGGMQHPAGSHPVRKGIFGVVALVSSPFVLFGMLFLLAGDDAGERVPGLVLVILLLPGLIALWRWAWPKR